MAPPAYTTIAQARWQTRIAFAERIVSALVARLQDSEDESPIIVRANRRGLGVLDTIQKASQMLFLEPVFIDAEQMPDLDCENEAADLIRRLRTSRKAIVLTSWNNQPKARQLLTGIMKARSCGSIVIVHAIGGKETDPDYDIGRLLGTQLWRDITYIEVDAPEILDDEAIGRLQETSD